MTFEDAIVFTLGIKPSDIDEAQWQYSLRDFRKIISLKMQYELAKTSSVTESLFILAAKLFPKDGKASGGGDVEVITDIRSLAGSNRWR